MEGTSIEANSCLPKTHCFVYNENKYHFNIDLFKVFSNYFQSKEQQEQNNIIIYDEPKNNLIFSDLLIKDFVNYCQGQKITLTEENASPLHKLAQKYKVQSLIDKTKEFMKLHKKEYVVDFLLISLNDDDSNSYEYEEIISDDLIHYIDDKRLLSLPISVLNSIVTKYVFKHRSSIENNEDGTEPHEDQKFIEFLFQCLDQYGKCGSVLFEHIKMNINIINRLINSYENKFDFHFINSECIKSIYRIDSDLIYKFENLKKELAEKKLEIEVLRGEQEEQRKKIDEIAATFSEREKKKDLQIEQLNSEMRQMREEILSFKTAVEEKFTQAEEQLTRKINEMRSENENLRQEKERLQEEIQAMWDDISGLRSDFETKMSSHNTQTSTRIDEVRRDVSEIRHTQEESSSQITTMNDQIEFLTRKMRKSHFFENELKTDGIISHLGDEVTITAGGEENPTYPISNIRKKDIYVFYNQYKNIPSESDSFIQFDFGESKRVDLHSYFITSTTGDASTNFHPKAWRIEGSNDCIKWTNLDHQKNAECMNGHYNHHHFVIQNINHGKFSNSYRYIRYIQEDTWYRNAKYNVDISYFELYGEIISSFI